jgi:hypothetical protein
MELKDFEGNLLKVGDNIIFLDSYSNTLNKGVIYKMCAMSIKIKGGKWGEKLMLHKNTNRMVWKYPQIKTKEAMKGIDMVANSITDKRFAI